MTTTQHQVIHLGRLVDADTDEATYSAENSGVYLQTFGSVGDPLKDHVITADFVDGDSDGGIETDNDGTWPGNHIDYDVGFGPEEHALDSLAVANIDVRSADGTIVNYSNVVIFQTTRGDLFLGNSDFAGTDIQTGLGGIESITVNSIDTNYNGLLQNNLQDFVCFAEDTLIRVETGDKPVQELTSADSVWTLDQGLQPVVWVGKRKITPLKKARPVRIRRSALGRNVPMHDLVVSPQHRVFVSSRIAQRMFGQTEVLIAAKFLTDLPGIEQFGMRQVTYNHVMLPDHHVICANGALMESFYLGREALKTLSVLDAVTVTKPRAAPHNKNASIPLARPVLSSALRADLLQRHLRHGRVLVDMRDFSGVEGSFQSEPRQLMRG